jgi:hypothetical protein
LSLGILERVEDVLRDRHGSDESFRLCHYFDLIAGTSTGAVIAAALAQGRSVGEVRDEYFSLGRRVFERSLLCQVLLRARYDERALAAQALMKPWGDRLRAPPCTEHCRTHRRRSEE